VDQNTAIEELHKLGTEVDSVTELSSLKPIYFRLDQIAKKFPDDFDVQVVVSELKQRLVAHGQKLKDSALGSTGMVSAAMVSDERLSAPPSPPTAPMGRPPLPSGQQTAPPSSPASPKRPEMSSFDSNPASSMPTNFTPTPPTAAVATPPSMQARVTGSGPTSFQSSIGSTQPPQRPTGSAPNLKRALLVGAGIGFVAFAGIAFLFVQMARNKNIEKTDGAGSGITAAGKVSVEFTTTPAGATIQVSGSDRQEKCVSNCKIDLAPGSYQVTATLDGYNPSASGVVVDANNATPPPVVLPLTPVAQSVKIISDITSGKVFLDGAPAGDLQEGQYIFDRIALGRHTVTIQAPGAEATFVFNAEAGKAPVVTSPATAKNLLALLVATAGNQAKLYTSTAVKVKVDGQDRGEVGGAGADLTGLSPGEHDLEAGEGKDLKKLVVSIGEMPMLTAYLKSDVNAGFLVIVVGQEDDVAVAIEGRTYPRKTQRGQLRVQLPPGKYRIKAAKEGFDPTVEQTAEIKKGEESKIAFALKAQPRVAQLKVSGATPGATVSIDRNPVGKIGNDGAFSMAVTQLGDKVIEFSLAGYSSRQTSRAFKAGETVALTNEGLLSPAASNIRLVVSPSFPEIKVTMRREGDATKSITETNLPNLTPGNYLFTATAKGYVERVERFALPAGEIRTLDLTLKKEVAIVKEPVVRAGGIGELEGNFTRDGDAYVQKGPAVVMFRSPQTQGVFTFTIRPVKGKKIRWIVGQKDNRSLGMFELEKNKLVRKEGTGKKLADSAKFDSQEVFQVRIAIANGSVVHSINIGGNWTVVDNWQDAARNFADGRFGFQVDGKDEIAISNFSFTPSK